MWFKKLLDQVQPKAKRLSEKQLDKLFYKRLTLYSLLGGIIGFTVGYKFIDKEYYEKYLMEFKNEDQIYNILENEKKPVLLFLFVPGDTTARYFRTPFMKSAKEYNDKCEHVMVNCAKHYNYCKSFDWSVYPIVQAMFPDSHNDTQRYKTIKYEQEFSTQGIKAFFERKDVGILKPHSFQEGLIRKTFSSTPFDQYSINKSVSQQTVQTE